MPGESSRVDRAAILDGSRPSDEGPQRAQIKLSPCDGNRDPRGLENTGMEFSDLGDSFAGQPDAGGTAGDRRRYLRRLAHPGDVDRAQKVVD
ncbi:MAG: hypothetical protein LVQ64_02425 [Thermoplasmatales archaeon]|nr:hypothetical protein [Thermoplasmatales archaeon]